MPELGFEAQNQLSSGFGARDVSPDSVIFTGESNFSLFSSASGSVDRYSFVSDVHDQDSVVSEINQHLAGHEYRENSSGPNRDPNKAPVLKDSHIIRKEKTKVRKQGNNYKESELEDGNLTLDSARNSFSLALKECQDRRVRSEALLRKEDRQRNVSPDLNNSITNASNSSLRVGVMKKSSVTTRQPVTFPSPETPNYQHRNGGIQKGWSSERVPLHTNANRMHVGSSLLPFNNGRTLPSKWEDAERWIFSPVLGDGALRPSLPQPKRRPKSKSGPLGNPGIAYYSSYSPVVPMLEGGNVGNLVGGSPFSTGVMAADGLAIRCGGAGNFPACTKPCMARSVSVHGCFEMFNQSSLPGSQVEKLDDIKEADNISRAVSRRDMATQMSPEGSHHSSSRMQSSSPPSTPSKPPIVKLQSVHSSKPEVRDVQVDEQVTLTRWSKKNRARIPGKCSENVDQWKRKAMDVRSNGWEVSETAKSISKMKSEEARITAWENLQKAKAEAAIQKLEMKLEKKRSSSMDKIMNKLRSTQRRAQEMRSSLLANQSHQVAKTSHKVIFLRRTLQIGALRGCFTCHPF
ncbi:unnamed protein product [Ilex paraguariensis]|uniref:Remorin C-terminal domain-containing protein n=1 Tax=Ilex paraguariensis TaxID=185542 RepID=A0ABC8QS42_9AQUA